MGTGLEEAGATVVHVNADPPRALRFPTTRLSAWRDGTGVVPAMLGPEMAWLSTAVAETRRRRAGRLQGVVQVGTSFEMFTRAPRVTFEDATVAQLLALGDAWASGASDRARAAWVARQRRAYAGATACCVASHWAADSVSRDYGVPEAKVRVVGLGHGLPLDPAPRDWNGPRFLFVGRDWERKNGPAVLAAFAQIREEVPTATLDVVGGHPRLDVPGVRGHGVLRMTDESERRRRDQLFRSSTCFVMPSRYEAFGMVYAEAGAAGTPSIGTTVGGSRDAIGAGGRVVDPGDSEALLETMRALTNADTARRLGALAHERAAMLTWRAVAQRVLWALGLGHAEEREPRFL